MKYLYLTVPIESDVHDNSVTCANVTICLTVTYKYTCTIKTYKSKLQMSLQ